MLIAQWAESVLTWSVILGGSIWTIIFFLPWRPWSTREYLESNLMLPSTADLSDISVMIPARNEAEVIEQTLAGVAAQGRTLKEVILIDDQSNDATAAVAQKAAERFNLNLRIISGKPLPAGWAGKLWALEQGLNEIKTPLCLLIDADIEPKVGSIATLHQKLKTESLDYASLMVELQMKSFWEKLLIPSFIYYFKLLYPFSLANSQRSKKAAGAGGCVLVKIEALKKIGGFQSVHHALIDDCSLAQKLKDAGFKIWIGLTRSVHSHRSYTSLESIWKMVARSAFTQLRYSTLLLLAVTAIMTSMYISPVIGLFAFEKTLFYFSAVALIGMFATFYPTLKFYGLSSIWLLSLPAVGSLYLLMTWSSAVFYFFGKRSEWKGRTYKKEAGAAASDLLVSSKESENRTQDVA